MWKIKDCIRIHHITLFTKRLLYKMNFIKWFFFFILGAKPPEESGSGHFACEEDPCRFGGLCDYDSEGQPQCVCPFECPAIRAPVCGSDGNFYDSDCHMKEQACKLQKKIVIVPRNRCQSKSKLNVYAVLCLSWYFVYCYS